MEYAYATLLLNESGEEINEENLTAVLEASGNTVETSRVKALVAALEGVDLDVAADEVVGNGADQTGLTDSHSDGEAPNANEADVDAPGDGTGDTSEFELGTEATTER